MTLESILKECPLIAILRGVQPDECVDIGRALVDVGIKAVEVPLNSPLPLISIAKLKAEFGNDVCVGAGTVMTAAEVSAISRAGAQFAVSPNSNSMVIRRTKLVGMVSIPGVATPSEAFAALADGANALKMFPGEGLPPEVVKAWRAVLPETIPLIPVGGVSTQNIAAYVRAGASGFGVGSAIYRAGDSAQQVALAAQEIIRALKR